MLSLLQIKNFALIDNLTVAFNSGLNVLTGETGTGKSIILEAIDIVLGGRINQRLIRIKTQHVFIEATFETNKLVLNLLQEHKINCYEDKKIIFSREFFLYGKAIRSRFRINGTLVKSQLIKQLRHLLIEITAQDRTSQLIDSIRQRELLDLYGRNFILREKKLVKFNYENVQVLEKKLNKDKVFRTEYLKHLTLLKNQFKELKEIQLVDKDELESLQKEYDRHSHSAELRKLSYQIFKLLYQSENEIPAVIDCLSIIEALFLKMMEYDKSVQPLIEMLRSISIQVIEIGEEINRYGYRLDTDPQALEELENKIHLMKQFCRKYNISSTDLIDHHKKITLELNNLENYDRSIEHLEQELLLSKKQLLDSCQKLTMLRKKAAKKLEKKLTEELKSLSMEKVVFICKVSPSFISIHGNDQVDFYFSPNEGEKIQLLSRTASGGEMSRFSLALKACFMKSEESTKSLIFDEIDTGVSGRIAQVIAEKLYNLSTSHQVLCVTHQPLVAAMATSHLHVEKYIIQEESITKNQDSTISKVLEPRTVVRIRNLNNIHDRKQELAKLTGGNSSEDAMEFIESLLIQANFYRSSKQ
ncbi:MAG: DNA replication and repair protein RecN [Candidatus Atelocyanobacterium thalassa isolate SIO64986]|uniref:DNA repair protein RecN n=1 Tax=Candidatus Atelocyanobacterium thalassa isolate SIO64986 TaxID=1527444 RepID=A0A086CHE2_9CHRO|nr:MAG: DNA replication and repair protein RecN [Candidatus Atelocyanobacterium thalassa isolate SIO64986]